jgi:hypothetical protein
VGNLFILKFFVQKKCKHKSNNWENKAKEKRLKLEQDRQAQEELARQKQEDLEEEAQRRRCES